MKRQEKLQQLREVLITRREAIRAALAGDISALRESGKSSSELADQALDSAHEEVTSRIIDAESRELSHIDEALQKFSSGSFGDCVGCAKPIPMPRLEALPYAQLCISCQVKIEKIGYSDWSELVADAYDAEEQTSLLNAADSIR